VRVRRKLDLLGLGSGVVLDVGTSTMSRELDTIAFELATEGDRLHRSGVLIQEIDLFERQALGLKRDVSFLVINGG